jgi:hypothetical protein
MTGRYRDNEGTPLWNNRINTISGKNNGKKEEDLNRFCFIFYRLKNDTDFVLSIFVPFWVEYLVEHSIEHFAGLALFTMLLGVQHFMTKGLIIGGGFQIKTIGLYGPVTININDYGGDVTLTRFTGLRLQYHVVPSHSFLPIFEKGFLLGYVNSISGI